MCNEEPLVSRTCTPHARPTILRFFFPDTSLSSKRRSCAEEHRARYARSLRPRLWSTILLTSHVPYSQLSPSPPISTPSVEKACEKWPVRTRARVLVSVLCKQWATIQDMLEGKGHAGHRLREKGMPFARVVALHRRCLPPCFVGSRSEHGGLRRLRHRRGWRQWRGNAAGRAARPVPSLQGAGDARFPFSNRALLVVAASPRTRVTSCSDGAWAGAGVEVRALRARGRVKRQPALPFRAVRTACSGTCEQPSRCRTPQPRSSPPFS